MAFVEVTARERILELYEAGLLWDSALQIATWDGPYPADWEDTACPITDVIGDGNWKFYILLED